MADSPLARGRLACALLAGLVGLGLSGCWWHGKRDAPAQRSQPATEVRPGEETEPWSYARQGQDGTLRVYYIGYRGERPKRIIVDRVPGRPVRLTLVVPRLKHAVPLVGFRQCAAARATLGRVRRGFGDGATGRRPEDTEQFEYASRRRRIRCRHVARATVPH